MRCIDCKTTESKNWHDAGEGFIDKWYQCDACHASPGPDPDKTPAWDSTWLPGLDRRWPQVKP